MLVQTKISEKRMRFLPDEPYRRAAYLVFYSLLAVFFLYGILSYVLPILLPFCIAFAAAAILRSPSSSLAKRFHLSQKVTSVILVLFLLFFMIGIVCVLVSACISQLVSLAGKIAGIQNEVLLALSALLDSMEKFVADLPFLSADAADSIRGSLGEGLVGFAKNILIAIATKLPHFVGRVVSAVPQAFFFFVVMVLAAIYFCADYENILSGIKGRLRGRVLDAAREIYGQTGRVLIGYLRSYAILFLFTFAELFVGFSILREEYAFLLALLIAAVDILPILGTGTILIPWVAILFLMGDFRMATGLLILYAVISIVRQFAEPRIVGAGIGLNPLLSLIAMYVGLRLFGFLGLLGLPILFVVVGNTVRALFDHAKKEKKP